MTEVSSVQTPALDSSSSSSSSSDVPHQYKTPHITHSQSLPELRAKDKGRKKHGSSTDMENHSRGLAKPLKSVGDSITILGCFLALMPLMAVTVTKHFTVGSKRKGTLRSVLLQVAAAHVSTKLQLRQLLVVSPNLTLHFLMAKMKSEYKDLHNYAIPFEYPLSTGSANWLVEAVDRKASDPVLVYFHGGGYALSAMKEHIRFLAKLYRGIGSDRLSILVHDYTLAPDGEYPTQLREAYSIYQQLVLVDGCKNIILGGDSAGGNLALVLMCHLHHGNSLLADMDENVSTKATELVRPIASILISPWVDLAAKKEGTYASNEHSDYVTYETDMYMSVLYCSNIEIALSPWVSPVYSEPKFWEGVLPKKLMITCGGGETALDRIVTWAEIAGVREKLYIEPNGIHVSAIFDFEKYKKSHYNVGAAKILDFCKDVVNT